ncbi:voltage-dependent potassium channel beta subunit, animal [Alkalispirochaeta americana]|uniref:Voltage-dependent potassium channel beta subunit, animal n=1 Tax=Alkalispirochaeta americana TaxID=159291 RepID=A0A1N6QFG5_9SPIO|nr:aldo/keto reductase [Alkalispirochaeta americana]SIQ15282.1 voltage-dependent potassium channel beta subunit, animal [Alkalispirochaeta americana]
MEYRRLGSSGLKVSALSFGSWVTFGKQVDIDLAAEEMKAALDQGVNFFDNAEVYENGQSEIVMGQAIKKLGLVRKDYLVSTKIFWGGSGPNDQGLSRKHILEGTRAALERLQVEYVDLIFCHRPDPETPIEETVRAMHHVIDRGWALYWGTSEWSSEQIRQAWETAHRLGLTPPTMEQPEYNMFHRDRVEVEYAPLYRDFGLGTTIWSPLASGVLTGKYSQGITDGRLTLPGYEWLRKIYESDEGRSRIEKVEKLRPIASDLGASLAQLAIAWTLKNPQVSTVITGASRPEQVTENMKALDILPKLDRGVIDAIEEVLQNRPKEPRNWRNA